MAISFVGQAAAAAASTAMPAHQAGDLITAFAYNGSAATLPTQGAGFTTINNGAANTNAHRLSWKLAASSSEASGTWTGASAIAIQIYRGVDPVNPIGANQIYTAAIDPVFYPLLSMAVGDGTSWVVGYAGIRSSALGLEAAPGGMTARSSAAASGVAEVAGFDTNGGVSSFATTSAAIGITSERYRSATFELRAAATGTSIPVGLAAEAETALALAARSLKAAGLSSDTEIALALTGRSVIPAGLSAEMDQALALVGKASALVALVVETSEAIAPPALLRTPVALSVSAETAQALAGMATVPVGLATEADAALSSQSAIGTVGRANEIDTALAMPSVIRALAGLASETEAASALLARSLWHAGLASEADIALALTETGEPTDVIASPSRTTITPFVARLARSAQPTRIVTTRTA